MEIVISTKTMSTAKSEGCSVISITRFQPKDDVAVSIGSFTPTAYDVGVATSTTKRTFQKDEPVGALLPSLYRKTIFLPLPECYRQNMLLKNGTHIIILRFYHYPGGSWANLNVLDSRKLFTQIADGLIRLIMVSRIPAAHNG